MDKIEPVAWMYTDKQGIFQLSTDKRNPDAAYWTETPLYAHPAQHDAGAVGTFAPVIEQVLVGIQGCGEHIIGLPELTRLIRGGSRITSIRAAIAAMKGPNNE